MYKKTFLVTLIALTFSVFFSAHGYTQGASGTTDSKTNKNAKINLNKIDFKQKKIQLNVDLLKNYFICTSIINESARACDNLKDPGTRQQCIDTYNRYFVLWKLAKKDTLGSAFSLAFKSAYGGDKGKAENMMSLQKGDLDACQTNNCRSAIKLDESLAEDKETKTMVIFMKAVKNKDPSICERLEEGNARVNIINICKAIAKSDPLSCESCDGVNEFKSLYNK